MLSMQSRLQSHIQTPGENLHCKNRPVRCRTGLPGSQKAVAVTVEYQKHLLHPLHVFAFRFCALLPLHVFMRTEHILCEQAL